MTIGQNVVVTLTKLAWHRPYIRHSPRMIVAVLGLNHSFLFSISSISSIFRNVSSFLLTEMSAVEVRELATFEHYVVAGNYVTIFRMWHREGNNFFSSPSNGEEQLALFPSPVQKEKGPWSPCLPFLPLCLILAFTILFVVTCPSQQRPKTLRKNLCYHS